MRWRRVKGAAVETYACESLRIRVSGTAFELYQAQEVLADIGVKLLKPSSFSSLSTAKKFGKQKLAGL